MEVGSSSTISSRSWLRSTWLTVSWDFLKYVITDTLNHAIALGSLRVASSLCVSLLPYSDFSQDVGARCSVCPQVRAVPNVLFSTLTFHRDDTGASGRCVSS